MGVVRKVRFGVRQAFRPRHTVSTKLALYSYDLTKVLVMRYGRMHGHGLPGGHLELGEQPEACLRREVMEELGATLPKVLQPTSFFLRGKQKGSVILAYTAIAKKGMTLAPPRPKYEAGIWVGRDELDHLEGFSPAYREFVLKYWPQS